MASSWKLQLRSASFRGCSFGVTSSDKQAGRRGIVHEFPQRDMPYVEDMGLAPQKFSVTGFCVGSSYMSQRDALEKALQQAGSGTLVHPWYGEIEVAQAEPYKVTHTAVDGGMCVFEMVFVRTNKPSAPTGISNSLLSALGFSDDAASGIAAQFNSAMQFAGQAEWVITQTYSLVSSAVTTVRAIMHGDISAMADVLGTICGVDLSPYVSLGEDIWSEISPYVFANDTSGENMESLIDSCSENSEFDALKIASKWCEVAKSPNAVTSPTISGSQRSVITKNAHSINALVTQFAIVEATRAAISFVENSNSGDFVLTKDKAVALRDNYIDAIDSVFEADSERADSLDSDDCKHEVSSENSIHGLIVDMRSATLVAIADAARRAPDVVTVQTARSLPSLVLSYRYTDGIELESDLIDRNEIIHPGFCPSGSLEVLKNV